MDIQITQNKELKLVPVTPINNIRESILPSIPTANLNPFIEANTKSISLSHLQQDCIIPVFSKDNEKTIAHFEFIDLVGNVASKIFPHHEISQPEIRISHQIKGRIPSAIHKSAKDLLDHEKTIYYERMAFIIRVPSITKVINGNKLELMIDDEIWPLPKLRELLFTK